MPEAEITPQQLRLCFFMAIALYMLTGIALAVLLQWLDDLGHGYRADPDDVFYFSMMIVWPITLLILPFKVIQAVLSYWERKRAEPDWNERWKWKYRSEK